MNPCKKWNKTEESDFSNLTYRAVKWCFTRSAILRSHIIYYSNKWYIFDCEFHRNVYDCTYMRKLSVTVIVLTIWFKNSSFFSLFITSFWTISWNSYIFHFFCRNDLNACDLPGPMSEVHCGGSSWLAPLNFMVHAPVRTIFNPRIELHSSKRVNHMHSERYDKKNEKI